MNSHSTSAVRGAPVASPPPDRPRLRIRADLPAAFTALCAVSVAGLPLGCLWALLAPPRVVEVLAAGPAGDQVRLVPLDGQSEQHFTGTGTFLLFGLAAGVLIGSALWLVRHRRGPVMVAAGVLGSMAAAWLAARVGQSLVDWYYPPGPLQPGEILVRAPVLESLWVVIAAPFAVAMTYAVGVAWDGTEDLGRET